MREALHIFSKDVRRLWPRMVGNATVLCAAVFYANRGPETGYESFLSHISGFAAPLALLSSWYLIIELIHEDSLVDDRQYWLTRPYSRGSLLAAKLLFLVASLSAPVLFMQFLVLLRGGAPLLAGLPALLVSHVFLLAWLGCPPLLLALVTRGIGQIALAAVGLTIGFALFLSLASRDVALDFVLWRPIEWLRSAAQVVMIGITAALLAWFCYWRRRIQAARAILLCTLLLVLLAEVLPVQSGLAVLRQFQPAVADSVVRIEYDPRPMPPELKASAGRLWFPVRVSGIPAGTLAIAEPPGVLTTFEGKRQIPGYALDSEVLLTNGMQWLPLDVPPSYYPGKDRPYGLALRVNMVCTLLRDVRQTTVDPWSSRPDSGRCVASPVDIICTAPIAVASRSFLAFRNRITGTYSAMQPRDLTAVSLETPGTRYSMLPRGMIGEPDTATVHITGRPYAWVLRTVAASRVPVYDYASPFRRN